MSPLDKINLDLEAEKEVSIPAYQLAGELIAQDRVKVASLTVLKELSTRVSDYAPYLPEDLNYRGADSQWVFEQLMLEAPSELDINLATNSAFWRYMENLGAKPMGNQNPFVVLIPYYDPGSKSWEVRKAQIPYDTRRGWQNSANLTVPEFGEARLRDIYPDPVHPLWKKLGLPGPLQPWGVSVVVTDGRAILVGKKVEKYKNEQGQTIPAPWGGMQTTPAGTMELEDIGDNSTVIEAILRAALRELHEETGWLPEASVVKTAIYPGLEVGRLKTQAHIVLRVKSEDLPDVSSLTGQDRMEFVGGKFSYLKPSPELEAGVAVNRMQTEG